MESVYSSDLSEEGMAMIKEYYLKREEAEEPVHVQAQRQGLNPEAEEGRSDDGQGYSGGEMDDRSNDSFVKKHRLTDYTERLFESKDEMRNWYSESLEGGFPRSGATEPLVQSDCTHCSERNSAKVNAFYLTRMFY